MESQTRLPDVLQMVAGAKTIHRKTYQIMFIPGETGKRCQAPGKFLYTCRGLTGRSLLTPFNYSFFITDFNLNDPYRNTIRSKPACRYCTRRSFHSRVTLKYNFAAIFNEI
jgi:hypothetical protein